LLDQLEGRIPQRLPRSRAGATPLLRAELPVAWDRNTESRRAAARAHHCPLFTIPAPEAETVCR
jgi:hypothetical protein